MIDFSPTSVVEKAIIAQHAVQVCLSAESQEGLMFDPVVHDDPYEAEGRLAELGLNSALLVDSLRQGELQRRMASPLDPPSAPGVAAWARCVRSLRENLLPSGWVSSDRNNLSTVVSPDGRTAIAVATGDEVTGNPDPASRPRTKYPRGSTYVQAIERNVQLELFPDLRRLKGEITDETVTWVLLRRSTSEAIFAELSRPVDMGDDGRVNEWAERIILGRIDLGLTPDVVFSDGSSPREPVVDVHRKTS